MPQIILKIKDDLQVLSELSCFVVHPVNKLRRLSWTTSIELEPARKRSGWTMSM